MVSSLHRSSRMMSIYILLGLMATKIVSVFAATPDYIVDQELLPENIEIAFEFINSAVAIGIALLAFKLSSYLKGSKMEKGWNMVVLSTILFVIKEIYGALKAIGIIHIAGLRDLLEFISMGLLLYGFWIIFRTYSSDE